MLHVHVYVHVRVHVHVHVCAAIERVHPIPYTLPTSENLTQRFSVDDIPAAVAITSAMSPSSPEHGDGLSFTSESTNAYGVR